MQRIEVYKETFDDWCPSYIRSTANYPNDGPKLVQISFMVLPFSDPKQWRVCAWGGDDLGMERDFDTYTAALHIFMKIVSENNISKKFLEDEGFVYA